MNKSHVTITLILLCCQIAIGQTYYGVHSYYPNYGNYYLHRVAKVTISGSNCSTDIGGYLVSNQVDTLAGYDITMCPNGNLYALAYTHEGFQTDDSTRLFQINKTTGVATELMDLNVSGLHSLNCRNDGQLYAITTYDSTIQYRLDLINQTTVPVDTISQQFIGNELLYYDGYVFGNGSNLYRLDFDYQPSEIKDLVPFDIGYAISFNNFPSLCNTFVTTGAAGFQGIPDPNIYLYNIDEETTSTLCTLDTAVYSLTGFDEYNPVPNCPVALDLDHDNSSGALGNDFNSAIFTCKVNNVRIVDEDLWIPSYPFIDKLTVSITNGILDPGKEALWVGLVPGVTASGSGTTTITFDNLNGNSTPADFIAALKLIQYKDIAQSPLGGQREITVSFICKNGTSSVTAVCHIQVQQLPSITVNLGPDRIDCIGATVTLDAGNPGMTYYWSGQQTTQTIATYFSGTYKVTVSDGVNCPGSDEVKVTLLPVVQATVQMPVQSCAGDSIPVTITWNTNDAFDIVVVKSTGDNDTLYAFTSGSTFFLTTPDISNLNAYTLTGSFKNLFSINSTKCLKFLPPNFSIQVHPTPEIYQTAKICEGDSIYLAGAYRYLAGVYTQYGYTSTACNQAVITTLTVKTPGNKVTNLYSTTCDPSQAGVFTQHLYTQNVCDSTVITTVSLLASDTVFLASQTCDPALTGVFTQNLTNSTGCDSIIITMVNLTSSDTVFIASQTCDPALAGVFTQTLTNQAGCDSVVVNTVSLAPSYIVAFNHPSGICQGDSAAIEFIILGPGSYDFNMVNLSTGESELISGISSGNTYVVNPSQSATYLTQQVIGPNTVGCLEINNLLSISVTPTIYTQNNFLLCEGDSLFVQNAWQTSSGIYVDTLSGIFGCDSIITTNVSFSIPSDSVFLASQTCNPALAGVFTQNLTNGFGCDSTVVTTITLLPNDSVFLASQTCDPASAGIFTQNLTNGFGCDSTVITTITLLDSDTVFLASQTCDPALAGVFTQNLTNGSGCDSTVVTTITLLPSDTIFLASQTCDPALAGVFTQVLTNSQGCDSTIVNTISLSPSDMVMLNNQTCDPSAVGTSMAFLMNQYGCDSVVVTTTILALSDTVFLASQTCDPALAGISTANLTNQYGCDSVVVTTTSLLSTDTTLLSFFTCDTSQVGISEILLLNAFGCDSLLIEVTSLLPADSCQTPLPDDILQVYAPNAFSPNGDGFNDVFLLFANEKAIQIKLLQIYDRWGERIFETQDQHPNDLNGGWDGYFKGEIMDVGIYVYRAEIIDDLGVVKSFSGEFLLIQ